MSQNYFSSFDQNKIILDVYQIISTVRSCVSRLRSLSTSSPSAYAGKPSSLGPLLQPSSAHRSKTLAHPTVTRLPSREYKCTSHPNPGFLRALHLPPRRRHRCTHPHPPWVSSSSSVPQMFSGLSVPASLCASSLSLTACSLRRGVQVRVGAMEEEAVGRDALRAARALLGVQAAAGHRPPHQAHPP